MDHTNKASTNGTAVDGRDRLLRLNVYNTPMQANSNAKMAVNIPTHSSPSKKVGYVSMPFSATDNGGEHHDDSIKQLRFGNKSKDSGLGTTCGTMSSGSSSNTSPESLKDADNSVNKSSAGGEAVAAASTPSLPAKKHVQLKASPILGSSIDILQARKLSLPNHGVKHLMAAHQLSHFGTPIARGKRRLSSVNEMDLNLGASEFFSTPQQQKKINDKSFNKNIINEYTESQLQTNSTFIDEYGEEGGSFAHETITSPDHGLGISTSSIGNIVAEESTTRRRVRRMHPCEFCDKQFDRPSLLKRHTLTHTGERPFECRFCNKGFSTRSGVNTHERTHTGQRPYLCRICGRRFAAGSNLIFHKYTHTNTRRHTCSQCPKAFVTPGDLRKHEYTHTGEWPFRCEVCQRGFATERSLKSHELTHTGKKPYGCHICHKSYAQDSSLKTHLKTHLKDTSFTETSTSSKNGVLGSTIEYSRSGTSKSESNSFPNEAISYEFKKQTSPNCSTPSTVSTSLDVKAGDEISHNLSFNPTYFQQASHSAFTRVKPLTPSTISSSNFSNLLDTKNYNSSLQPDPVTIGSQDSSCRNINNINNNNNNATNSEGVSINGNNLALNRMLAQYRIFYEIYMRELMKTSQPSAQQPKVAEPDQPAVLMHSASLMSNGQNSSLTNFAYPPVNRLPTQPTIFGNLHQDTVDGGRRTPQTNFLAHTSRFNQPSSQDINSLSSLPYDQQILNLINQCQSRNLSGEAVNLSKDADTNGALDFSSKR